MMQSLRTRLLSGIIGGMILLLIAFSLLKWLLFTAASVNAGLALIIGAYVVRSGLRPLNTIAAEIAAIRVDSLTARIGARHVPA